LGPNKYRQKRWDRYVYIYIIYILRNNVIYIWEKERIGNTSNFKSGFFVKWEIEE
jgi:hypothetical protein